MGSAGIDCDECEDDRETGLTGYLRLGGYLRPNLFLGGETNGWLKSEDGVDSRISHISAVGLWYPQPATGFFLKTGLGFSLMSADDDIDELSSSGMGLTLGGGYDWRTGANFAVTPFVNYLRSFSGSADFNGVDAGDLDTNLFQFGIGVTWF